MYNKPAVGTILPAQENTTLTNPGAINSADGLTEWLQARAQNDAFNKTQTAAVEFLSEPGGTFPQWRDVTYPSLKDPDSPPPQPPAAFVVIVNGTDTGGITFAVEKSGTPASGPYKPVCQIPWYRKIAPPANPADNKISVPVASSGVTLNPVDQFEHTIASNGQTYMALTALAK